MVERVFPMTADGKQQLEEELETLKLEKKDQKLLKELKLHVLLVTYLKTQNTNQQKMNKVC